MRPNHADHIYQQHKFWSDLATRYARVPNPDPDYLRKTQATAAEWAQKWDSYVAYVRSTNQSLHLRP